MAKKITKKKSKELSVGEDRYGRPRKFKSPEELSGYIDEYFKRCDERVMNKWDKKQQTVVEINSPIPYTVEGLCNHLGIDRMTLMNYRVKEGYEDFFACVKDAVRRIQQNKMEGALDGTYNPVMAIFLAKNNFGYVDKTEQKQEVEHKHVQGFTYVEPEKPDEKDKPELGSPPTGKKRLTL